MEEVKKNISIISISDTHLEAYYNHLPETDIFIHAGDLLLYGNEKEFFKHIKLMGENVKALHKIFVPGNHDKFVEKNPILAKEIALENGITLLNHEYYVCNVIKEDNVVRNIKVFGSPFVPEFTNGYWAFERHFPEMAAHWQGIIEPVDILITHSPPFMILDCPPYHYGSKVILEKVKELSPKLHIFGHCHASGFGQQNTWSTTFANVAWLNEDYKPIDTKKFCSFIL